LRERREELETKELDLRRSLEKFNTFLTVKHSADSILINLLPCWLACLLTYLHLCILNAVRCPYVRSYVRNAGRGQLSSEWRHNENDVIMITAGLVAGCERHKREPSEWRHNDNSWLSVRWRYRLETWGLATCGHGLQRCSTYLVTLRTRFVFLAITVFYAWLSTYMCILPRCTSVRVNNGGVSTVRSQSVRTTAPTSLRRHIYWLCAERRRKWNRLSSNRRRSATV